MKKVLSLATCLLLLAPAIGSAKDAWYNGLYLGVGAGATRVEANLVDNGLTPGSGEPIQNDKYKKSSITYKLFAGYRIIDYLAIEAGYMETSDTEQGFCFIDAATRACLEDRGGPSSSLRSTNWTIEIPLKGFTGYVVGLYPINDTFEVYAKLGAIAWEADVAAFEKLSGAIIPVQPPTLPAPNQPIYSKVDDIGLAGGLGVNFNHESGFAIRTEIEFFDINTKDYVDQFGTQIAPEFELSDSYQFTLSAMYTF